MDVQWDDFNIVEDDGIYCSTNMRKLNIKFGLPEHWDANGEQRPRSAERSQEKIKFSDNDCERSVFIDEQEFQLEGRTKPNWGWRNFLENKLKSKGGTQEQQ